MYRNRDVLPRIFAVTSLRILPTGRDVLDAVSSAPVTALGTQAFAARDAVPAGLAEGRTFRSVSFRPEHHKTDSILIATRAEAPGLLIVANSFSPYWRCAGDREGVRLFPVYHAFWGVSVPEGTTMIACVYRPPTLTHH